MSETWQALLEGGEVWLCQSPVGAQRAATLPKVSISAERGLPVDVRLSCFWLPCFESPVTSLRPSLLSLSNLLLIHIPLNRSTSRSAVGWLRVDILFLILAGSPPCFGSVCKGLSPFSEFLQNHLGTTPRCPCFKQLSGHFLLKTWPSKRLCTILDLS